MRDLKADLELCNKATPGPWEVVPGTNSVSGPYPRGNNKPQENMMFIAQAREGWPHAIERALKAEDILRELVVGTNSLLTWWLSGYICKDCPNPSGPASTCISECCDILDGYRQVNGILGKTKEVLGDEA